MFLRTTFCKVWVDVVMFIVCGNGVGWVDRFVAVRGLIGSIIMVPLANGVGIG